MTIADQVGCAVSDRFWTSSLMCSTTKATHHWTSPRLPQNALCLPESRSECWQLSWSALCPDSCPGQLCVLTAVLVSSVSWQLSWSALCPDSCPGLLCVLSAVLVSSVSWQLSWSALCTDSCPGQLCVLTAVLVSSVYWQLSWSALCPDSCPGQLCVLTGLSPLLWQRSFYCWLYVSVSPLLGVLALMLITLCGWLGSKQLTNC